MNILIPLDCDSRDDSLLCKLEDVKKWAFIELDEGKISSCNFFDKRDDISDWIDCVIVISEQEYVWPFIEENIAVLVAPVQRSIDDVVEAFLFKELHDLNV